MIRQSLNHFRWQLADDFAPLLEELLRAQPASVVKDDRAKFVARYEAGGRAFFLKRYRHGAFPLRPAKFFFKRSQAAQEWQLADELEQRGVPVVRHVALGERWSARGLIESVLITEAFAGVALEPRHEKFFPRAVQIIEGMAAAGVGHDDLHPANILVNEATGDMRLIDLYGARVNGTESREALRRQLLAQLGIHLPLPVDAASAHAAHELRKLKLAERARRCLKTNRDFARGSFGKLNWRLRRDALQPAVEKVLCDPDAFLVRARVLKAGRSSTVGAADGLVLKRNNFKKPLNLLKDLVRGSRGRRDFLKGYHLELCGIPTARVLATADSGGLGLAPRSFVLMEEIADARPAAPADRATMRSIGWLIAHLHHEGFTHRDLKETNILFDAEGRAHLIDLDGLKFVNTVASDEAARNLQRLVQGLAHAGTLTRPLVVAGLLAYCRTRKIRPRSLFPRASSRA